MLFSSDHPDTLSRTKFRMPCDDITTRSAYYRPMPRKTLSLSPETFDWYLQDWMRICGVTQAELGRLTGWPKATVSDIYHGKTHYYRDILNQAAKALKVKPYELLLPVEEANEIRTFQQAVRLVADRKSAYVAAPAMIENKEASA